MTETNAIKLSIVSYLNSKPFLYGLFLDGIDQQLDLSLDIPSLLAQKLIEGQIDIGLVPVAAIPQIPNAQIISDYCIGTIGEVKTVCIYSHIPIQKVEQLYLDFHSRTSVALTKVLLKEYWKLSPQLLQAEEGYIHKIEGTTAGLVIGDRTMGLEERFAYTYDLGEIWKKHTGLPFVFAAWVSNKSLDSDFIKAFNQALKTGVDRIPQVAQLFQSSHQKFDVLKYFQTYISYNFDDAKKKALALFLEKLKDLA
jgi:chorismate dehydratase